jgi:hypothetical protein
MCVFSYLVNHVLELSLGGVLAEGAHHSAQLLGGDGAVTILRKRGDQKKKRKKNNIIYMGIPNLAKMLACI